MVTALLTDLYQFTMAYAYWKAGKQLDHAVLALSPLLLPNPTAPIRHRFVIVGCLEEGIVVGGGCTLLRLAAKVDAIKDTLENDEQKVGAEIVRRALSYPLKLIVSEGQFSHVLLHEMDAIRKVVLLCKRDIYLQSHLWFPREDMTQGFSQRFIFR